MSGEELINPIIKSKIYINSALANDKIQQVCLFKSEYIGSTSVAVGAGLSLNFHIPNATRTSDYNKNNTEGGILELVSTNVTNGSESFDWRFKARNSGTLNTVLSIDSTGSFPAFSKGPAELSSLTAVALSADTSLEVTTHSVQNGKYVTITGDAKTLTLPNIASSSIVGATFIIVNINADGGGLLTISPNSNDKFLVDIAGADGTDNKDILNTKATQNQYDYVKLIALNTDGWLIDDIRGTWIDQS